MNLVKFEGLFVKARIANFKVISSKTFMCCPCSFFDHFLPIETPLQCAPHSFVEATILMII